MNIIVRVNRDKLRQIKFNITLSSIENEKTTSAISRHDSIF